MPVFRRNNSASSGRSFFGNFTGFRRKGSSDFSNASTEFPTRSMQGLEKSRRRSPAFFDIEPSAQNYLISIVNTDHRGYSAVSTLEIAMIEIQDFNTKSEVCSGGSCEARSLDHRSCYPDFEGLVPGCRKQDFTKYSLESS